MRKMSLLLLFVILLTNLVSCGDKITVEKYVWRLKFAEKSGFETSERELIACSKDYETDEVVPIVEVFLTAQDGIITISDNNSDENYAVNYERNERFDYGITYKLSYQRFSGDALVNFQKDNENSAPTLMLTLSNKYDTQYELHFVVDKLIEQ